MAICRASLRAHETCDVHTAQPAARTFLVRCRLAVVTALSLLLISAMDTAHASIVQTSNAERRCRIARCASTSVQFAFAVARAMTVLVSVLTSSCNTAFSSSNCVAVRLACKNLETTAARPSSEVSSPLEPACSGRLASCTSLALSFFACFSAECSWLFLMVSCLFSLETARSLWTSASSCLIRWFAACIRASLSCVGCCCNGCCICARSDCIDASRSLRSERRGDDEWFGEAAKLLLLGDGVTSPSVRGRRPALPGNVFIPGVEQVV